MVVGEAALMLHPVGVLVARPLAQELPDVRCSSVDPEDDASRGKLRSSASADTIGLPWSSASEMESTSMVTAVLLMSSSSSSFLWFSRRH